MNEPVENVKNRILTALGQAKRNRRQLNRTLDKLEKDIRRQTGEKDVEWTEEYYLYLMEVYCRAIDAVIPIAVRSEEYEWAEVLTKRRARVESTIGLLSVQR